MTINDLIFDTPYWVRALLGATAVILFVLGYQRQNKRLIYAGICVLGVGVLLVLLSYFIETDKEIVQRRTRELLAAVVSHDETRLRGLVDPHAHIYGMNADQIIHAVKQSAEDSKVISVRISSLSAEQDASGISAKLSCVAEFNPDTTIPTIPTSWVLEWDRNPQHGWCVYDAKCTGIMNQDPAPVIGYIEARR